MAGFVPAIDPAKAYFNLDTLTKVSQHVAAEATLKTAIMGGSLKDNLGSAALGAGITIGGAKVAGKIGDSTLFQDGKITKVAMHAALGGLMAEALGGDFRTGALAAGANEALVKYLGDKLLPAGMDPNSEEYKAGVSKLLTASQLIGALTAGATGGDASAAAEVAANGTQYNFLEHLPPGLSEYGSAATTLAQDMQGKGYTNEQIAQSQLELARGQGFEGVQPANEFVKAWTYFMAGELTGAGLAAVIGRFVLGGGAKAIGAAKPLVSEGSEVTAEVIQKALQGDPAISAQGAVSLPAVQRYVDRLIKGDVAPAIKMDGNVIVDGDHRYIAAKILGRNPDVTPGGLSPNKVGQTKPVSELKVDQVDWGNK